MMEAGREEGREGGREGGKNEEEGRREEKTNLDLGVHLKIPAAWEAGSRGQKVQDHPELHSDTLSQI